MATSRRRSGIFARPKSMMVDAKALEELTEELDFHKSRFNRRSAGSRNSSSTILSMSKSVSNSSLASLSSGGDINGLYQPPLTPSASLLSPSQSVAESTDGKATGTHSSSTAEAPPKRDIFGRMKSSLDRRKMPWSQSTKNLSAIVADPAERSSKEVKLKDGRIISSTVITATTPTKKSKDHSSSFSDMKRSASTLFAFNTKSRDRDSSSSPSSDSATHSVKSSPASSVSSVQSPSPSPIKSQRDKIPETIIEDELYESMMSRSRDSAQSCMSESASLSGESTSRTSVAIEPDPVPTPQLRPVPRGKNHNGKFGRPQTIVGFFRQSRIFSNVSPTVCDVFGLPLRRATMLSRMDVERDDGRYWTPAIVPICTEFLNKYGLHEEGLYRISGSVTGTEELKKEFAFYGQSMVLRPETHDVHTVASLLKSYIRSLPEEIVTPSPQLFALLTEISTDIPYEKLQAFLSNLPVYNFHLLRLLCSHFSLVAASSHKNRMTLTNLILILCPTMRIDSKLLSWMIEGVDQCLAEDSSEVLKRNERAAMIDETRLSLNGNGRLR